MIQELGLNPREIFGLLFLAALALIVYLDRKKIERHYIVIYRRTKRGIVLLDRIAKRAPRFWQYYGWAGVLTGILSLIIGTALFAYTVFDMVSTQSVENGPSLILPGLGSEATVQPGVTFIPFEYWLLSIAVLMVAHEMSHGIVARACDFELNSVGWVILGIFPGAFVEPKGENMFPGEETDADDSRGMWEQGEWTDRLRVLGAGSFANYIVAGVFFGAWMLLLTATTSTSGVFYVAQPDYAAAEAGMTNGTLTEINDRRINSLADLQNVSRDIQVNETVRVWTSEGNFTMIADQHPERDGGYIGIRVGQQENVVDDSFDEYQGALQWMISLLYTVSVLNLLIGLFNMLPIKPLDGGLMLETIVQHYDDSKLHYVNSFSVFGLLLILSTLAIAIAAQVI